jgi:hypothetical protein
LKIKTANPMAEVVGGDTEPPVVSTLANRVPKKIA